MTNPNTDIIAKLDRTLGRTANKSDKPTELVYVNVFINTIDAEGNPARISLPFNSGLVNMPDKEEKGSTEWVQEAKASNAFKARLIDIAFDDLAPGETIDLTPDCTAPGTIGVELYRKKEAAVVADVENPHMAALATLTFTKKSA